MKLRGFTLLSAQQWAGTLTVLFAFAGCAVSAELAVPLVLAFPLAMIGAAFFGERTYGKAEWAWNIGIVAFFIFFALRVAIGKEDIVLASASFVELLCIHRLWHRRTQRDEMLLLLLALLFLCAGAALSAELLFGFAFLGFSVAATWAMALTHLRFEVETGAPSLLRSRRVATPQLLGALAALSTLGLVGAAIIFVAFPRVTIGGLRRASHKQPITGLNDRVDLSLHGAVANDPRVVLRVRLSPDPGSERIAMHWKARSLPVWTGQGWRAGQIDEAPANRIPQRPRDRPGRQHALSADIEAVAGFSDGVVLTPEGWILSVDFHRPLTARGPQQHLIRNLDGDFFYAPTDVGDMRYTVTVYREEIQPAMLRGRGEHYPDALEDERRVPADLDPRIAALAKKIAGGKDPADAAAAIETWLSTNLAYTRDLAGDVPDPIANFLFVRKQGHCELFSSAMVLMLRTLGIPARNVTGYFGGERTSGGYYAVRGGDAHSWVEVWFPGAGFVRFDPTPASDRGSQQDGVWPHLVLVWDALQQRWRSFVVDFDLVSQGQALQQIGAAFSQAGKRLSGKGGGAPRLRDLLLGLGAFLAAGLLAFRLRRARRQRGEGPLSLRPVKLGPSQRRAQKTWRKARQLLGRAGIEVRDAATPREVARNAPAASALAQAVLAARWGEAELPRGEARRLLRELSSTLRR